MLVSGSRAAPRDAKYKEDAMFDRKKAGVRRAADATAAEAEQTSRTAKAAHFRSQRLAREDRDKIAARMSPAEKSRAQANSMAERRKNTPSV